MADTYSDEMKGVLFKNKDKQPGDQRPDYKGHCQIGGNKLWMAAWLRTSNRTGERFMSFAFEVPQQQTQGGAPAPTQAQPVQAEPVTSSYQMPSVDDIPF